MSADTTQSAMKEDIVVRRIIDAPVEQVWRAWTDPSQVIRWWGPKYHTSPSCKIDLREGGKYVFCMRAPAEQGGQDMYTAGVYKKIVPMERLEFTQGMSDKDGNPLDPAAVGMPADFPKEIRTVVTLKPFRGDMTELTITEYDWPVSQMYVYSLAGLHQTIDKLAASLENGPMQALALFIADSMFTCDYLTTPGQAACTGGAFTVHAPEATSCTDDTWNPRNACVQDHLGWHRHTSTAVTAAVIKRACHLTAQPAVAAERPEPGNV